MPSNKNNYPITSCLLLKIFFMILPTAIWWLTCQDPYKTKLYFKDDQTRNTINGIFGIMCLCLFGEYLNPQTWAGIIEECCVVTPDSRRQTPPTTAYTTLSETKTGQPKNSPSNV